MSPERSPRPVLGSVLGPVLEIQLDPLDPLLFGDNRSARAGEDHALADQDPSPTTFFGAVGARIATALGAFSPHRRGMDWARAEPVLGPFDARVERDPGLPPRARLLGVVPRSPGAGPGQEGRPWFARPLHLVVAAETASATGPRPAALLRPRLAADGTPDPALSSVPFATLLEPPSHPETNAPRLDDEDERPLLVSERLLEQVLTGRLSAAGAAAGAASITPADLRVASDHFEPERRIGLQMDNRRNAARDAMLFSRPYRRFDHPPGTLPAGFTAWLEVGSLDGPDGSLDPTTWNGTGFLGGDRRRVACRFETLEQRPLGDLCSKVQDAVEDSRGFTAVLLTPAAVPIGVSSRPADTSPEDTATPLPAAFPLAGREPLAAALGRPRTVSGWRATADTRGARRGPRPLRTLLPEGSVFFYRWHDDEGPDERRTLVERHWLAPLHPELGDHGFGRVLIGVWR